MARTLLAAAAAALLFPATAGAYGWPLKPFHRTHPLRGGFDDPRLHLRAGEAIGLFHFGVDIAAPDWTPVYAVEPGRVATGPQRVSLRRPNRREFGYWHVIPVVRDGSRVRLHQLLGYVAPGWGHLHFAESVPGHYRNPLRPGALSPYRDDTEPVVASVSALRLSGPSLQAATPASAQSLTGTVALVADAYDLPPLAPPAPWSRARLTPALLRWRLVTPAGETTPWRVVVDFERSLPPPAAFWGTYAPGTYQNKPNRPGDYRFWLTRDFDTAAYPDGTYSLQVEADDLAGHRGSAEVSLTIANGR